MQEVIFERTWNEDFFHRFATFKNKIHQEITTSFPESPADYEKYFGPNSVFTNDFHWCALMVLDLGKVVAQAIFCWRKGGESGGNLGFLDWQNDEAAAKALINATVSFAREQGIKFIKTPVDLNFFIKYRIRLPGGDRPFFGEPVYPDYYHHLFQVSGLRVVGEWDTFHVNRFGAIKDFFSKRKKLSTKNEGRHSLARDPKKKTTIRGIRMGQWDQELQIIHQLFTQAYQTMPEFEPISFEQFKVVYDDFKYIMQPWLSYIVELQGRPVAFSINFVDPLPILMKFKGKKLGAFQKFLVFLRLRMNLGTFIIAHVGKIPGPGGEEIKGVQIQVSKRIAFFSLFMRRMIVSFQHIDSPSHRSWNATVRRPYARYVLYGREI